MPYKYIGKTTDFCGKTLWEIVGNLKNFGVGRLVTRSRMERYPEKSFMKILKVEALPNPKEPSWDNLRKVKVQVERTFRGVKQDKIVYLESATYKSDYKLIPKNMEHEYLNCKKPQQQTKIFPKYMELPPLLQESIKQEKNFSPDKLRMEIDYNESIFKKNHRIANDDEKPTVEISIKLKNPSSPRLFKGINL